MIAPTCLRIVTMCVWWRSTNFRTLKNSRFYDHATSTQTMGANQKQWAQGDILHALQKVGWKILHPFSLVLINIFSPPVRTPGTSLRLTIATFIVNCIIFYCILYFIIFILYIIIGSENLPWGSGNKVYMYVNRSAKILVWWSFLDSRRSNHME